jgi:hypothetical protein
MSIFRLPNNLMSINSFGFGGANVHAVLEANENRKENENSSRNEARVAFACARTADGCEHILKRLKQSENNIELQALITENSFHPSHTHPYRGFTLLNSAESSTTIKVKNFDLFYFPNLRSVFRNVITNDDQYGLYFLAWAHNGRVWDVI